MFSLGCTRSYENFIAKTTPILRLYAPAGFLLKAGFWVVCVDEKTSIQAREPLHQSQPAAPDQPVHIAERYKQKGALHLFAALQQFEIKPATEINSKMNSGSGFDYFHFTF